MIDDPVHIPCRKRRSFELDESHSKVRYRYSLHSKRYLLSDANNKSYEIVNIEDNSRTSSIVLHDTKRTNNNRMKIINSLKWSIIYCLFMNILLFNILQVNSSSLNANKISPLINKPEVRLRSGSTTSNNSRVTVSTSYSDSVINPNHNYDENSKKNISFALSRRSHATNRRNMIGRNATKNSRNSIARPFYTKITSNDAVAKPYNTKMTSNLRSADIEDEELYDSKKDALKKPSKLFSITPLMMESSTDKSFMTTSTTGKTSSGSNNSPFLVNTDSGPKIRLEPFFNIFNTFQSLALGTSKEQESKFSPSYQTIRQSIDENIKLSNSKYKPGKSTKGMRNKKKNKNRVRISEENNSNHGPIPIPIPKPVIVPDMDELIMTTEPVEVYSKPTLHPMDILNVAISSSSSSSSSPSTTWKYNGGDHLPEPQAFKSLEAITKPSHGPFDDIDSNNSNNKKRQRKKSSEQSLNKKKRRFETSLNSTTAEGPESRERQLRTDFLNNFHDSDIDLQADETNMTPEIITGSSNLNKQGGGKQVNIPQGYSESIIPVSSQIQFASANNKDQEEEELNSNLHVGRPNRQNMNIVHSNSQFSTLYPSSSPPRKEDIELVSKYPMSFTYNKALGIPPSHFPHYPSHHNSNYYHNSYSNYPYGKPISFSNHYSGPGVGHSYLPSPPPAPLRFPSVNNKGIDKSKKSSKPHQEDQEDIEGESIDVAVADNEIVAASSNEKIGVGGVMSSFDLFFKEYKILAWASFFIVTAFCMLAILVYLYVNNPPTEVVTAKQQQNGMIWNFDNILGKNPQIMKFLSSIVENNYKGGGTGKNKRRKYKQRMGSNQGSLGAEILSAIKKDL